MDRPDNTLKCFSNRAGVGAVETKSMTTAVGHVGCEEFQISTICKILSPGEVVAPRDERADLCVPRHVENCADSA